MNTASHAPETGRPRTGVGVLLVILAVAAVVGALWAMGTFTPRPRVALVTASQGPYWDLIIKGAREAAQRHNVRLDVIASDGSEGGQTSALQRLADQDYAGVAISPNDPLRQARLLAAIGAKTNLVTYDADLPVSRRLCFVGTDNYEAGRMCGQQVRRALPRGGKVVIAVGSVEKENGHRRRQGVIDELLERTFEPNRPADPVDAPLKGPKYTIAATLVDNLDAARATQLAADAIKKHPDLGCFVGLFASNTPAILKALEGAGKLGQVKVVGFDANEETLAGIEKGHVHATIAQDAYNIGYQAVRILADAAAGDPNAIPLYPTFYLRCDEIVKENLEEMRQALARRNKPPRRFPEPDGRDASLPPYAPTTGPAATGEQGI